MLGVRTSNIRALRRALEAAGASIQGEYHDTPSGAVLAFADLDGNPIDCTTQGESLAALRSRGIWVGLACSGIEP